MFTLMWQLPLHWAGLVVKDYLLLVALPSPCLGSTLVAFQTIKNQWSHLHEVETRTQGRQWVFSLASSSWTSQPGDTHGDSAAGAGGGRHVAKPLLQRACRKQLLPCLVPMQSCGLNLLLHRRKKIPPQYKEINTDINTNNPITFVLTAW